MGVSCQIYKSTNGTILEVTDTRGNPSALYQQALEYTNNREEALDIWSTAYTENYEQSEGIWVSEPSLNNVLGFINSKDYSSLSGEAKRGMLDSTLAVGLGSMSELLNKLSEGLNNTLGYTVTRQTLDNIDVFTEAEKDFILSDTSNKEALVDLYFNLKGTPQELLNKELEELDPLLQSFDASNLTPLGKPRLINPVELDNRLKSIFAGKTSQEEFDEAIEDLEYESIAVKYRNDPSFRLALMNKYSNLTIAPVYTTSGDNLVRVNKNSDELTYQQTLKMDVVNDELLSKIDTIQDLPEVMWSSSIETIKEVVKEIEGSSTNFGIDIIGLSDKVSLANRQNVIDILEEVAVVTTKLRLGTFSVSEIGTAMKNIIELNGNTSALKFNYVKHDSDAKAILELPQSVSESRAFGKLGLLKLSDTIFQKIKKIGNTNRLVEKFIGLSEKRLSKWDLNMFKPTAFDSDGNFSYKKYSDPNNAESLRKGIVDYLQGKVKASNNSTQSSSVANLMEMEATKIAFNITTKITPTDYVGELKRFSTLSTDPLYLNSQYLSDFYVEALREKFNDTPLYNEFLKHIVIDGGGIRLTTNDPYVINMGKLLLPSTGTLAKLKEYTIVSKDENLRSVFREQFIDVKSDKIGIQEFRDLYVNNPQTLPFFEDKYEIDGDVLVVPEQAPTFIKVREKGVTVFERIGQMKGMSIFKALPNMSESPINILGNRVSKAVNLDVNGLIRESSSEDLGISIKLPSTKELTQLKEDLDACN
jgi:hypothetical protein|tara:strand:+ start:1521 stop:3797 length:2277 start_codon:yes stop_codon:yes gene_type:complete